MKQQRTNIDPTFAVLQQLGISLDPLQQMSGLVNLINQTQAPGIQQQQFGEEMDYRQQQGDRSYEQGQAELQQRQLAEQNNQANFGQSFGLQERQLDEQTRYNNLMDANKDNTLIAAQMDRANNNKMDFVKLLLNIMSDPNGTGMVDPNTARQYVNQSGFQGLINPQQQNPQQQKPLYNTSNINSDLPDDKFQQAYKQRTGQ
jgi:hypothetical protein